MDLLLSFLVAALLTLGSGAVLLALFQQRLLYRTDPRRLTPAACGLPAAVSERVVPMADGTAIVEWSAPAAPGQPTLLYFHGQAGHLERRKPHFERMTAAGLGVVMPAYRGYSGSQGRPSEHALVADGIAHVDRLLADGLPRERLILYGASLGAAVAVQVAVEREPAGLVLVAPFLSVGDLVGRLVPSGLAAPLLKDRYETRRHIQRVRCPILILHGEQDGVVPVRHGRVLAEVAKGRATLVTFPFGGHNDLYRARNDAWTPLVQFLDRVGARAAA